MTYIPHPSSLFRASACRSCPAWCILPHSQPAGKDSTVMDQMPTDGFRDRPVWLLGVAALV
ncbi:MAG TPA: hypothetical protein VG122_25215, partial [Gemmata sp.]|nr:hypothetical protein [Gemmata sp.]